MNIKLFFVSRAVSELSDHDPKILQAIKKILLAASDVEEVFTPASADAIIIQEENSFKNFRYIKQLRSDVLVGAYPEKVFTINTDDCATGLLRGLYTSLPKSRFNLGQYAAVPYMEYPNPLIFSNRHEAVEPLLLASWRGNTKSNGLRVKMVNLLKNRSEFSIETTNSWLNHPMDEQEQYVHLIRAAKFSLCPAGWASVSFRIYESMALGRCPVIIADGFVPPPGPDWEDCALFYPEKEIAGLVSFLKRKEHEAHRLGQNALLAWQKFFRAGVVESYYASALLSLIRAAPPTSRNDEFRRWNSAALHWNNKWTVPQRAINRIAKFHRNRFAVAR